MLEANQSAAHAEPGGCCSMLGKAVVAGLESNRKNNLLISILFLEQTQAFPHTLPHIFVHLTVVLFSVLTGKLNKWVVRAAPDRNIMVRSDAVQLRVSGLVSSMPDAAPPTYANWLS
jgi:hypothetical protein